MAGGLAERWKRSLPSVRESALRAAFLRSELLAADRDAAAEALDNLADGAEQADPVARDVLAAALPTLTDPAHFGWVEALRETAHERSLLALARLLRRRRVTDAPDPGDPSTRPLRTPPGARTLTLGERKALARRPTRLQLDRLLADPHPAVIRALLCNTRITEDDVVRMAARRPAYPDVLAEIARAPQWTRHARVRMALVQNPGTPAEVAVPLCGLLIKPELRQVVAAVDVPAIVRAAAIELLQRRPLRRPAARRRVANRCNDRRLHRGAARRDAGRLAQARQAATDRYGMVGDSTGRGRAADASAAKRKQESAEAARSWPQRAGDARQRLEAAREEVRVLLAALDGVLRELAVAATDAPPELELATLATERLRESRARAELALLRAQEHADLAVDALYGASLRPSDTREIGKPTRRSD